MVLPGLALAQAQIGALQAGGPPTAAPTAKPGEAVKPPEGSVGGMGDINLYPKRVVIDARSRVASIGLYNRTANTGDYDITLGDMMMQGDGRLVDLASVTDPAARARVKTASAMLRWSPHRVTLPGSEAQMVRVMAHLPPDLPPGEYRAHFSAIAVPPDGAGLTIEQAAGGQQAGGVGVRIVPRFGISIPVIVRVGETTLTTGLTGLTVVALPGGGKAVAFTITRQGTRSAFGDIVISAPGAKAPLAEIRGIGVYPEIDARQVQIPIAAGTDPKFYAPGARLTVTYTDDDFAPGKLLVRQEFTVP